MSLEVERAARMAGQLCLDALEAPADGGARETLADALLALENAVFADDGDRPAHVRRLMHQASVWSDIGRGRIEANRSDASVDRALRQVQRILATLIDALADGTKS